MREVQSIKTVFQLFIDGKLINSFTNESATSFDRSILKKLISNLLLNFLEHAFCYIRLPQPKLVVYS